MFKTTKKLRKRQCHFLDLISIVVVFIPKGDRLMGDVQNAMMGDSNLVRVASQNIQRPAASSLRLDFFQYMIANTDFSTQFLHNIKAIQTKNGRFIPIAYDFDMSGVVNAPYATFDEKLGIKSVGKGTTKDIVVMRKWHKL